MNVVVNFYKVLASPIFVQSIAMKFIYTIIRAILDLSTINLLENLHVRLVTDWINNPSHAHLHPDCTWMLPEEYSRKGMSTGVDFYNWYVNKLAIAHQEWNQVVTQVIGSRTGAIVLGTYHFKRKGDERSHSTPFCHFYQVHQRKIVAVRYFVSDTSVSSNQSRSLMTMFPVLDSSLLN